MEKHFSEVWAEENQPAALENHSTDSQGRNGQGRSQQTRQGLINRSKASGCAEGDAEPLQDAEEGGSLYTMHSLNIDKGVSKHGGPPHSLSLPWVRKGLEEVCSP